VLTVHFTAFADRFFGNVTKIAAYDMEGTLTKDVLCVGRNLKLLWMPLENMASLSSRWAPWSPRFLWKKP